MEILDSTAGPVLVAVVSDGAGSATHSDFGSALAVSSLIQLVATYLAGGNGLEKLTRETAVSWIDQIAQVIEAEAIEKGHAVRDYASTLLAAIVGEELSAFIQIGDGAIVVSHGEGDGWAYVFWPQHGEFANTTNFVVSFNASEAVEFDLAPRRIQELAIFSDGIEKLVLHDETKTVHEKFFNSMFPPVRKGVIGTVDQELSRKLEDYLASPTICERTDDDKTLILATRIASNRVTQ